MASAATALTFGFEDADGQSKLPGAAFVTEASSGAFAGDQTRAGRRRVGKTIDEAMQFSHRTGFGKEARYLKPGGAAIEEDWLPEFRFYVSGPPRSSLR